MVSLSLHFCLSLISQLNAHVMNVYFLTAKCKHRVYFLMFDLCQSHTRSLHNSRPLKGPYGIAHPPTPNNQRPVHPHSLDQGGQPLLICLSVRPFDCRSSHLFLYFPVGIYRFFFIQAEVEKTGIRITRTYIPFLFSPPLQPSVEHPSPWRW